MFCKWESGRVAPEQHWGLKRPAEGRTSVSPGQTFSFAFCICRFNSTRPFGPSQECSIDSEKSQGHLNYQSQFGKMAGLLACWAPDWKEHRCLALLLCAPHAACEISQNGMLLSLHILHFATSTYGDMFVSLWLNKIVIIVITYIHWQAGWLWKDTQSEQHSKKSDKKERHSFHKDYNYPHSYLSIYPPSYPTTYLPTYSFDIHFME